MGTFACAASANTLNQVYEIVNDAKMERTKRRPLPTGRLSRGHALLFAGLAGSAGIYTLATQVTPHNLPILRLDCHTPQCRCILTGCKIHLLSLTMTCMHLTSPMMSFLVSGQPTLYRAHVKALSLADCCYWLISAQLQHDCCGRKWGLTVLL